MMLSKFMIAIAIVECTYHHKEVAVGIHRIQGPHNLAEEEEGYHTLNLRILAEEVDCYSQNCSPDRRIPG